MCRFAFVLLISFFVPGEVLFSTDYTWNIDSNGDWNNNADWSPATGFPNAAGDTATFGSVITASRDVNINGTDITVGGITFNNANTYFIESTTSNTLNLPTGTLINAMSGAHEIQIANLNLNAGVSINTPSSAGSVFFDPLSAITTKTFTVTRGTGAQDMIVDDVSGGGLIINGNGITVLGTVSSFVSYNTSLTINGGTVQFGIGGVTDGTNAFTIGVGGTLNCNAVNSIDTLSGSGTIILGAELDVGSNNGSSTFSGKITGSGGTLVLLGTGTLVLNGTVSNDFTGDIGINSSGTLELNMGGGAIAVPHNLVFNSTGTALMDAANQFASTSAVNLGSTSATFNLSNNNQTIGSLSSTGTGGFAANVFTGAGVGGILTINTSGSSSFAGKITQNGGLTVQGTGTFILAGAFNGNTYTGATTIESGTLQAGTTNTLSINSIHTLAGGTLNLQHPQSIPTLVFNSGALTQGGNTLSLSGSVNALTMQGNNTISGPLLLTGGTSLNDIVYDTTQVGQATISGSLNLGSISRTFFVDHNASNSIDMAVSGPISNSVGAVRKIGTGVLQFSGSNTYTGGTGISAGTLSIGADANLGDPSGGISFIGPATLQITSGLSSARNVLLNSTGTIQISSGQTAIFSGAFTGAAGLTLNGAGTLNLTGGSNVYTGATTVSLGRLSVNGSLTTSGVTVGSGATLGGAGTITAPVTINSGGTLSPGNSIGTLNIIGNVVQGNNSTLASEINPTTSSLVNITGSYAIGSGDTLYVTVDPGVYPATKTYTLVTASTGVSGEFSTVTLSLPTFRATVTYDPDDVILTEIGSIPFSEVVIGGNAGAVAICLDTLTALSGSDLELVLAELRMIPTIDALREALALLQPSQFTALAMAQENTTLYTNDTIFQRLHERTQICPPPCKKTTQPPQKSSHLRPQPEPVYFSFINWRSESIEESPKKAAPQKKECKKPHSSAFWVSPFGAWARQDHESGQVGFNTATGGVSAGLDVSPSRRWTFGGALGYSHIHLNWEKEQGDSNMNNAYGALYASAAGRHAYLFGAAMGSYNHYNVARNIDIDSDVLIRIDRTAKSSHHGWQGSGHLQGGLLFGQKVQFSPFIEADYIYVHENSFNEHGAQSLDLHVKAKNSDFLQAEGGIEISRCFSASARSVSPSIGFSVIREWRFIGKHYKSSFEDSSCVMRTSGMNPDRTLYSPAAGLTFLLPDESRLLSFEYKGKFGDNYHENRLLAQFLMSF